MISIPGRELVADRGLESRAERIKDAHEAPSFHHRVTANYRCCQYFIDKICLCHGVRTLFMKLQSMPKKK